MCSVPSGGVVVESQHYQYFFIIPACLVDILTASTHRSPAQPGPGNSSKSIITTNVTAGSQTLIVLWLCWPAEYAVRTSVLGRDRLQCAVLVSTLWLAGTTTGARPSVAQSSLPSTPTLCQQWAVSSEQWGNRKKDFFIKLVWWVELVEELQSQTEFLFCLWEMLTIWNNFRSVSLSSEWTQYYLHDC